MCTGENNWKIELFVNLFNALDHGFDGIWDEGKQVVEVLFVHVNLW